MKSITLQKSSIILHKNTNILKRNKYYNQKLMLPQMFSSDCSLDNARNRILTVDLVHDRHTVHYFKDLNVKPSNENICCTDDETVYDEDDCFTFDSHLAPKG